MQTRHWLVYCCMERSGTQDIRLVLAHNVRELRHSKGMSQEALAEVCGLHRTFIGIVERGESNISLANIDKIAIALGVEAACLLARASS